MVEDAAVAFLDILGYKKIIKKGLENNPLISGIENIIKYSINLIKESGKKSDLDKKPYWDRINEVINARFISDSAIFTLNLSKISAENQKDIAGYFQIYLLYLSSFYLNVTAKIGCIQRGGLSRGAHYENTNGGHLFIFSEAYVNAYELQRKDIEKPKARVIVDKETFSYLKSIPLKDMNRYFYEDEDGEICFKLYCFLEPNQGENALNVAKLILNDIKKGLTANIRSNIEDDRIIGKLRYFVEYHNKTILMYGDKFKEFLINLDIFDK